MPSASSAAHHHERHPGASLASCDAPYKRREPETTVLYELVQGHLADMIAQAAERSEHGFGYPGFIEDTFERYLACGLLSAGFVRVRCDGCGFDRLVAFSCKTRGLCPSCNARRMHDSAAHLVDRVLAHRPYRQWVFSFPRYLRFQLARDTDLLSKVLRGCLQVVFAWQRRRARARKITGAQCGAVTFVQRFGGFVNLNVHYHALLPDGVFVLDETDRPTFVSLDPPSDEEIASLAEKIIRRIARILARHLDERPDDDNAGDALARVQAASVQATFSPPHHHPSANENQAATRPTRRAFIAGFSLHANVAIHQNDRDGLERLCRYGLRPAFALERLSWTDDGQIRYEYKRPAPNGSTSVTCAPTEFLAKLAALLPPPRKHLTRYHGVFAPNHSWRSQIVPSVPKSTARAPRLPEHGTESATETEPAHEQTDKRLPATILARRLDWAALMLRVFEIDVLECPRCSGRMRVLAFITEPDVVERILNHLGISVPEPPTAARSPPSIRRALG